MSYTNFIDAYARETTFGEEAGGASTVIPDTNAVTYLFGDINQESQHPSPRTDVIFKATSVGKQEVAAGELWKGNYEMSGMYGMSALNGILLQAVMGKSVTQDDTPSAGLYTHTITPPTAVDGVLPLLPSFAIQHERTGLATDWSTQWLGMKVSNLKLICKYDEPRTLVFIVDWMSKKALKVGFTLTPDPILPPTLNGDSFLFNDFTREIDLNGGFVDIEGLIEMELSINPGLLPEYTRSQVAGVDTSMWPKAFTEAPRKDYVLILRLHPESSAMWEEVVASTNTGDIRFKWVRHATDDYIQCDLLDCQFTWHEQKTPDPKGGVELIEEVIIKPRACSFIVVDKIAKTHYGEAA